MAHNNLDLRNKKFNVEVTQYNSTHQFENCTYQYFPERNELNIVNCEGMTFKFIGNFSAEIVSMEDYKKTFNIHD